MPHRPRSEEETEQPVFERIPNTDRRPEAGPITKVLIVLFVGALFAGFGLKLLPHDINASTVMSLVALPGIIGMIWAVLLMRQHRKGVTEPLATLPGAQREETGEQPDSGPILRSNRRPRRDAGVVTKVATVVFVAVAGGILGSLVVPFVVLDLSSGLVPGLRPSELTLRKVGLISAGGALLGVLVGGGAVLRYWPKE